MRIKFLSTYKPIILIQKSPKRQFNAILWVNKHTTLIRYEFLQSFQINSTGPHIIASIVTIIHITNLITMITLLFFKYVLIILIMRVVDPR